MKTSYAGDELEPDKEEQEFKMIFPLEMFLLGNNTVNHLINLILFVCLDKNEFSNTLETIPTSMYSRDELITSLNLFV